MIAWWDKVSVEIVPLIRLVFASHARQTVVQMLKTKCDTMGVFNAINLLKFHFYEHELEHCGLE